MPDCSRPTTPAAVQHGTASKREHTCMAQGPAGLSLPAGPLHARGPAFSPGPGKQGRQNTGHGSRRCRQCGGPCMKHPCLPSCTAARNYITNKQAHKLTWSMISRGLLLSISAARASQSSWAAGGASTAAAFTACGGAVPSGRVGGQADAASRPACKCCRFHIASRRC